MTENFEKYNSFYIPKNFTHIRYKHKNSCLHPANEGVTKQCNEGDFLCEHCIAYDGNIAVAKKYLRETRLKQIAVG